ncbi:hypothetical protein VMF7928_01653 [Vibrio marisflavi CECT 7928]|uniref:Uncharacterized protein n=1 Tax=Vibrio marisflavi CECT 7928 TaxID=634439 RepID=A0ABM9A2I9_9VIBR|nr:hypothetical protein VMF7928_01653 [Vibrio marisflavi CECT 7928]
MVDYIRTRLALGSQEQIQMRKSIVSYSLSALLILLLISHIDGLAVL